MAPCSRASAGTSNLGPVSTAAASTAAIQHLRQRAQQLVLHRSWSKYRHANPSSFTTALDRQPFWWLQGTRAYIDGVKEKRRPSWLARQSCACSARQRRPSSQQQYITRAARRKAEPGGRHGTPLQLLFSTSCNTASTSCTQQSFSPQPKATSEQTATASRTASSLGASCLLLEEHRNPSSCKAVR